MRTALVAVLVLSAATTLPGLGRGTISNAKAAPESKQREPQKQSLAKEQFQKAERYFALGRFERALRHYELAYSEEPIPAFLFNIAQCYRNLGELDRAIFTIEKYLQLEKNKEVRKEVRGILARLKREQARKKATELGLAPARKPSPPSAKPVEHNVPKRQSRPIYTRWWFLTAGSVVAAGVAAAFLVNTPEPLETDLGILKLGK